MILPAASSSALRIRRADGTVVGAGFLVDGRHAFTCAHVVAEALACSPFQSAAPEELVVLDFPLLERGPLLRGRVVVWQAAEEDWDAGDIAGLELLDPLPEGARPALFAPAGDVWDHTFRAFGFPQMVDSGMWSSDGLSRLL